MSQRDRCGVGSSAALESLETSFHQDLNGDGVIGVPATHAIVALPAVTVVSNDRFVFHPGIGADIIAKAASTDTIELNSFSSISSDAQLATLLNDAQTGQFQTLFKSTNDGHDTVINLGNHDSITLVNFHLADLHASNFIIH